jgi:YD repeat-containing protein
MGAVSYTYDATGRRLTMSAPGQSQTAYAWDNANRLTGITREGVTAFSHCANGNLTGVADTNRSSA